MSSVCITCGGGEDFPLRRSAMISVRMPEELMARLDPLAKSTERSRSYLATPAIEEFVSMQEWQVRAIQQGIEDARAGRVVSHAEAIKELNRWGPEK